MKAYNKAYWDRQPKGPAPAEYSRPDENPVEVEVTTEFFRQVAESELGWRTWKRYKTVTTNRLVEE
jgi:hypothetical protein